MVIPSFLNSSILFWFFLRTDLDNKIMVINFQIFDQFSFPQIAEVGQYVAIDLSGKNLRIMLLTLRGKGQEPTAVNNNYIVPNHVMKGTGDQVRFFQTRIIR